MGDIDEHSNLLKFMLDKSYVAHDSAIIFNKIMAITHSWFESDAQSKVSNTTSLNPP